jgi:hypothetical protein
MQRGAGHDRETTASGGGSPLTRQVACLVLPEEGDAFETSAHTSCEAQVQYAACVQIPGLNAPVAQALPEQRVDLGGSCALKHCSDQLPDRRGHPADVVQTHETPDQPRLARHPERRQAIHTMSAISPKASSARGVLLAKRATVTEACSPSPVRRFLRAALPGWAGRAHGFPRAFLA